MLPVGSCYAVKWDDGHTANNPACYTYSADECTSFIGTAAGATAWNRVYVYVSPTPPQPSLSN
jgi:hypothetical protein